MSASAETGKQRAALKVVDLAKALVLADSHFLIRKNVREQRTFTEIKLLDYDGRLKELARILDGVNVTQTALAHAEKLMEANNN